MSKYFEGGFVSSVQKLSKKIRSEDYVRGGEQLFTLFLRKEGIRNIGHGMSIILNTKKSNFGNQQCLRFHTWFIISFWHFITKCDSYFITKCDKGLLQNAPDMFYYNSYYNMDVYYKIHRYSYKFQKFAFEKSLKNLKLNFKYCNVNIFQLMNFYNCRILN